MWAGRRALSRLTDLAEWRLGTRGIALLPIGVMWLGRGMVIAPAPKRALDDLDLPDPHAAASKGNLTDG